jgi:hypothetical protein
LLHHLRHRSIEKRVSSIEATMPSGSLSQSVSEPQQEMIEQLGDREVFDKLKNFEGKVDWLTMHYW